MGECGGGGGSCACMSWGREVTWGIWMSFRASLELVREERSEKTRAGAAELRRCCRAFQLHRQGHRCHVHRE